MRSETAYTQKTNLTSLAATAGVMGFVLWAAAFATQHDSIYAQIPRQPAAAIAGPTAIHNGADVVRSTDRRPNHGQG